MIPQIVVTQKTMYSINPSDMMIPTDKIEDINKNVQDQLVDSRDTNREA